MREIETLKKKDKNDLTDTEKEKIATENYWRDILNPPPKEEYKESLKEKEKRLKKEEGKKRKQEEKERIKKEKEEKKMREIYEEQKKQNERYEERKKNYEEQQKQYEEHKKQHEEWKKQNEREKKENDEKTLLFKKIETEFKKVLLNCNGNLDKTFRKCSLHLFSFKTPFVLR